MPALLDSARLESMIRELGGETVSLGGVQTAGLRLMAGDEGMDLVAFGGAKDVLIVPSDALAAAPAAGDAVNVGAENLFVLDHRRLDDGKLLALAIGSWTHAVSIYRGTTFDAATLQQQDEPALVAAGVPCDLEIIREGVDPEAYGRIQTGQVRGRFPPGTDLQRGDFVKVTSGNGPATLEVEALGDETDDWRLVAELTESQEALP